MLFIYKKKKKQSASILSSRKKEIIPITKHELGTNYTYLNFLQYWSTLSKSKFQTA